MQFDDSQKQKKLKIKKLYKHIIEIKTKKKIGEIKDAFVGTLFTGNASWTNIVYKYKILHSRLVHAKKVKNPLKMSRSLDECDSSHDRMPHETRVHPSSGNEILTRCRARSNA